MKHLFLLIIILFLLTSFSCSDKNAAVENILSSVDRRPAQILSYSLGDNSTFLIRFSERVLINEVVYDGTKRKTNLVGENFTLPLDRELGMGEKYTLALTFEKNGGNTGRAYFTLYGINDRKASLLINEVSMKGDKTNPDRIELLVTKKGNTAGFILTDEVGTAAVVLPPIEVTRGDIIVVYWETKSGKTTTARSETLYTYYVDGGADHTLIGTTGAVLLYDESGGDIVDGLLYSDFTSASTSKEKYNAAAALLSENGEWEGPAVDSTDVRTTRVLARMPGGVDTNSADDWFVTAVKKATWGEENVYAPYIE